MIALAMVALDTGRPDDADRLITLGTTDPEHGVYLDRLAGLKSR